MRIIVCDDNMEARAVLRSHIKTFLIKNNSTAEVSVYKNAEAFLEDIKALSTESIVVAFLDIYMTGMTGVDAAKKIREVNKDMIIIFTTSSLDHTMDSWSVDALQYLVKPVNYGDVDRVLGKCMKLYADSQRFIEVLSNRIVVRVLLREITHIEVLSHSCLIHTLSKTINSSRSLDDIEKELDKDEFVRTDRSFIVNMHYVEDITENSFLLKNGIAVPISKKIKQSVKQTYEDYVFGLIQEK